MVLQRIALALVLAAWAAGSGAVQPDEVLDDPVLEERARDLSEGLRCLVCQNESIDESNAALARDLRLLVRERLVAGDSDSEVLDYITARYGEFVLLRPRTDGWNIVLWAAGPLLFLTALGLGGLYIRGRATAASDADKALSAEEQARLAELLAEDDGENRNDPTR